MATQEWHNLGMTDAWKYKCGYPGCGREVASSIGYWSRTGADWAGRIYICPYCENPTFTTRDHSFQVPGPRIGREVGGLPEDVAVLYAQARDCVANSSFTAAVLAIRKILMHIAVEKGAKPGERFVTYVDHLVKEGWAPPGSKPWVDHIRTRGNEETHEIQLAERDDATELLSFLEMLLVFMYEFPARVPGAAAPPSVTS